MSSLGRMSLLLETDRLSRHRRRPSTTDKMSAIDTVPTRSHDSRSVMKAWLRALELTAPITGSPGRTLPVVIDELAEKVGDAPALLSERECMTYGVLADRSNRY